VAHYFSVHIQYKAVNVHASKFQVLKHLDNSKFLYSSSKKLNYCDFVIVSLRCTKLFDATSRWIYNIQNDLTLDDTKITSIDRIQTHHIYTKSSGYFTSNEDAQNKKVQNNLNNQQNWLGQQTQQCSAQTNYRIQLQPFLLIVLFIPQEPISNS